MKTWLFNPFERLAGWNSMLLGMLVLLSSALVASFANLHFDGVIDLHFGESVKFTTTLTECTIDWLCLSGLLYLSGLLFSKSKIRPIDVFGTQALARFPFLISALFSLLFGEKKMLRYIEYKFLHLGEVVEITALDVVSFGLLMLITLVTLVWMIWLMFKAYSVSCNLKGTKGVVTFIGALILAEIFAKILIRAI
jgi:hypothetical protein